MIYRRDYEHPPHLDFPTVSTVVIDAEDKSVARTANYTLTICHVREWHGRGFMPRINDFLDSTSATGDVFRGTDWAAYSRAQAAGIAMLQEYQQQWDADEVELRRQVGEREAKNGKV